MNIVLMFRNPDFKKGTNTTTRRGVKAISKDTTALAYDSEYNLIGSCRIVSVQYFRLSDMDDNLLRNQHDKATQTKSGLKDQLLTFYPTLHDDEIMTLITFLFTPV